MSKDVNKLKLWSIVGFFAIIVLGFLSHDLYKWTNKNVLIAMIAPVNESVWEHLKLGLWAVISFSVVEYFVIGKLANNYFFAKGIGALIISFGVLTVYYTYTGLLHRNIFLLDISSYIFGVLLCQLVCYKIFQLKDSGVLNVLGIVILIGLVTLFALCTFYPLEMELFKDHNFDSYGIEEKMELSLR